jgi:hypothetical protein
MPTGLSKFCSGSVVAITPINQRAFCTLGLIFSYEKSNPGYAALSSSSKIDGYSVNVTSFRQGSNTPSYRWRFQRCRGGDGERLDIVVCILRNVPTSARSLGKVITGIPTSIDASQP